MIQALLWRSIYNYSGVVGKSGLDKKNHAGGSMETTVIYSDGNTLKTDMILRKWLGGQRKFVAIIEGDSLIIKKTYSLLDFSSEPDEDFMSMEEINEEVHKARKENEHSR